MRIVRSVLATLAIVLTASLCASAPSAVNPAYDPARPHHTPDGFRNLYPFALPTISDLAVWYWRWARQGGTRAPEGGYENVPVVHPDLAYLRSNRSDTTITWIGHATLLLQTGALNILTDPMFSDRASPLPVLGPTRKVPLPFAISALPRIDVVLISHNHFDHLDAASVDALNTQRGGPPLFLVPLGVDAWMKERGIVNVKALDWWDEEPLSGVKITFVPAQHWSARSFGDRYATLWGGYVVEKVNAAQPFRFYFAGDTGYAPLFKDQLGARFGSFDLAAIPIGAYEPYEYLLAQHVNSEDAVRIHRDVNAKQLIAMHWGTFILTSKAFDQPPRDLATALEHAHVPADRFVAFQHGEMRVLQKASASVAAATQPAHALEPVLARRLR